MLANKITADSKNSYRILAACCLFKKNMVSDVRLSCESLAETKETLFSSPELEAIKTAFVRDGDQAKALAALAGLIPVGLIPVMSDEDQAKALALQAFQDLAALAGLTHLLDGKSPEELIQVWAYNVAGVG